MVWFLGLILLHGLNLSNLNIPNHNKFAYKNFRTKIQPPASEVHFCRVSLFLAAFETVLYTVYQSIEGGQLPRPDFKTRNAIVIREKTTGLALTPRTNNRNKLEFVGRWSDSNTTEYARVFAEVS